MLSRNYKNLLKEAYFQYYNAYNIIQTKKKSIKFDFFLVDIILLNNFTL